MAMDKITETVAHFAGIFHLAVDENRLREDYDRFKALQDKISEQERLDQHQPAAKTGYALKEFAPGGPKVALDPPLTAQGGDVNAGIDLLPGIGFPIGDGPAALPQTAPPPPFPSSGTPGALKPTLEPASSVATFTQQTAFLSDNDVIGPGAQHFTDPAIYDAQLKALVSIAQDAQVLEAPLPTEDATTTAQALHSNIASAGAPTLAGLDTHLAKGADAVGSYQNGASIDEMPLLDDLLPTYHQPEEPEEDDTPALPAKLDPTPGGSPIDITDVDPGHAVVAGGNMLINQTQIANIWLDAPAFAVMGDSYDLSAISQINVLLDHDHIQGMAEDAPSHAVNAASITTIATEDPAAAEADLAFPEGVVVARIDGDVTLSNWVDQFTFATDHDRAEVTFTGAETRVGLGDNLLVNEAALTLLGYAYDLIVVGGDMINLNMISQTNVLLDNDHVSFADGITGVTSGSDNLLFNGAALTTHGVNTHTALTDAFAQAGEALANGAETLGKAITQSGLFDDGGLLKVLHITGDFITSNIIQQTNILGDADQIHLAMEGLRAAKGGLPEVTTGSNALVNLATLSSYGTDSIIMTGGETYSDALLYQAELIDTDADPLGVNIPGLASEAVAFLADDMLAPEQDDIAPVDAPMTDGTPADVMQTMLA